MTVAKLLAETIEMKHRLTPESWRVMEDYYPGLGADSSYYSQSMESAYSFIYPFIASNKGCSILDVGCGVGTESLAFARMGARVQGIDVTPEYLSCANERLQLMARESLPVQFQYANVLDLEPVQPFDAVWLNQAYHHLEPRREVVAKLARLVRPGGKVLVSDTNAANPLVQLIFFRQRGFQTVREYRDPNGIMRAYGRERVTTVRGVVNAFAKHGFSHAGHFYYKVFPNSPRFARCEAVAKRLKLPHAFYANYALALIKA